MNLAVAALTHRQVEPKAYDVDIDAAAAAAGSPARSPRSTATGWSPSATPGSTASTCWSRGCGCSPWPPATPTTTGPRSRSAGRRGAARPPSGCSGPPPPSRSRLLGDLVDLYDEGRRAPLQLPLKTSFAWATAARAGQPAMEAAAKKWRSGSFPGEDADAAHVRVWGEHCDLAELRRTCPPWPSGCGSRCSTTSGGRCERTDDPGPFDLLADLPAGPTTTVLEASAGTGKTYALAGLVTRYVAEGEARLEDMLLITFSRAASQELRERVRDQLVAGGRGPRRPGRAPTTRCSPTSSPAPRTSCAARLLRLQDALAGFDAATIATTHEFCHLVLRSLGVAGDTDAGRDPRREPRRAGRARSSTTSTSSGSATRRRARS